MNTISFKCGITEVNELTTKFIQIVKTMSRNCWEVLPAVVTPLGGEMVLVTISYSWRYDFPAPQNFAELFGESPNKKFLRDDYIGRMRETWGK